MKVNFGIHKNKSIIIGNNPKMRPTTSMAKSIIFNSINFESLNYGIDFFSGTGSLGIEAISLGLQKMIFVDNNKNSIIAISQTLDLLRISKESYEVILGDFRQALKSNKFSSYDLIFLDPPFSVEKYFTESLKIIYEKKKLSQKGVIVLEKPYKMNVEEINLFKIEKEKRIGDKVILILRNKDDI